MLVQWILRSAQNDIVRTRRAAVERRGGFQTRPYRVRELLGYGVSAGSGGAAVSSK